MKETQRGKKGINKTDIKIDVYTDRQKSDRKWKESKKQMKTYRKKDRKRKEERKGNMDQKKKEFQNADSLDSKTVC
jgi:hypothetical protein